MKLPILILAVLLTALHGNAAPINGNVTISGHLLAWDAEGKIYDISAEAPVSSFQDLRQATEFQYYYDSELNFQGDGDFAAIGGPDEYSTDYKLSLFTTADFQPTSDIWTVIVLNSSETFSFDTTSFYTDISVNSLRFWGNGISYASGKQPTYSTWEIVATGFDTDYHGALVTSSFVASGHGVPDGANTFLLIAGSMSFIGLIHRSCRHRSAVHRQF